MRNLCDIACMSSCSSITQPTGDERTNYHSAHDRQTHKKAQSYPHPQPKPARKGLGSRTPGSISTAVSPHVPILAGAGQNAVAHSLPVPHRREGKTNGRAPKPENALRPELKAKMQNVAQFFARAVGRRNSHAGRAGSGNYDFSLFDPTNSAGASTKDPLTGAAANLFFYGNLRKYHQGRGSLLFRQRF